MKFDELDDQMRVFETAHDLCVLPGLYMVARLDGRSFTRLTKEVHQFEAPFDARFRDMMLATAEHLMTGCGFNVVYGYTQSDEISLLFALEENSFQRKLRKLHLGPVRRGQRQVLAAAGCGGRLRLPHLATALGGPRGRLLPLAQRGRPPQRPERSRLLAAPQAGTKPWARRRRR